MGMFDNDGIVNLLTNYLKTQFEIIKIDIQDKIEELLLRIFNYFLAALSIGITFLFVLMGIAAWLNDYLKSAFWGYFIVAAIALLATFILLFMINKSKNIVDETTETIDSGNSEEQFDLNNDER
jgi:predicted PurR-regulated permease PerM